MKFSVGVSLLRHNQLCKTVNLDGSMYLSLIREKSQSSRRSDFWAFQILAKTSQGSCTLRITRVRELIFPRNLHTLIPKLGKWIQVRLGYQEYFVENKDQSCVRINSSTEPAHADTETSGSGYSLDSGTKSMNVERFALNISILQK